LIRECIVLNPKLGSVGWKVMPKSSRKILPLSFYLLLLIAAVSSASQWQILETDTYRFKAPGEWKVVKGVEVPGPDFTMDLTGVMIPATHNKHEASGRGFITKISGASLQECINIVRRQNRANADKRFDSDSDRVEIIKLESGEEAAIIKTRWLLMSSNIHQTRYDLVVHSSKHSAAYTFAFYFAYFDRKYSIEETQKLDEQTRMVYETFEWK
jgi:hypothetical protein